MEIKAVGMVKLLLPAEDMLEQLSEDMVEFEILVNKKKDLVLENLVVIDMSIFNI